MYVYDFFIYHLRPFGIATASQEVPRKLKKSEMVEKFKESERHDRAPDVTKFTKKKKKKSKTTTEKPESKSSSSEESRKEKEPRNSS